MAKAIDDRDEWVSNVLMKLVLLPAGPEFEASVKAFNSAISFVKTVKEPVSLWKNVEQEQRDLLCGAFGLSMNGEGKYFIDAKGVLVIGEFMEQTTNPPTAGNFETPEDAEYWLGLDCGLNNPDGSPEYHNIDLLADIAEDIEDQFGT